MGNRLGQRGRARRGARPRPSGGSAAAERHLGASGVPRSRKRSELKFTAPGADKCCGDKVTIDHGTLSRCIS